MSKKVPRLHKIVILQNSVRFLILSFKKCNYRTNIAMIFLNMKTLSKEHDSIRYKCLKPELHSPEEVTTF